VLLQVNVIAYVQEPRSWMRCGNSCRSINHSKSNVSRCRVGQVSRREKDWRSKWPFRGDEMQTAPLREHWTLGVFG